MRQFNFKSFTFYAVAIGSVVVLFKVVTAYGETLKAPPPIAGRYRVISESLPPCLQSSDLLLNIQQSGVYLNGSLLALAQNPDGQKASSSNLEEKPSLSGRWHNQKLGLSGLSDKLASCEKEMNVTLAGEVNGDTISGEITIDSAANAVNFTAQKEVNQQEETKGNH